LIVFGCWCGKERSGILVTRVLLTLGVRRASCQNVAAAAHELINAISGARKVAPSPPRIPSSSLTKITHFFSLPRCMELGKESDFWRGAASFFYGGVRRARFFFGAAIGIARVLTSAIIELYLFVPFVLPSKGGVAWRAPQLPPRAHTFSEKAKCAPRKRFWEQKMRTLKLLLWQKREI
jgi:hypothetical protein